MAKKNKDRSPSETTSSQSLEQLDKEVIRLLEKRARLLGRSARGRQERQQSLVDPNREKSLWKTWLRELVEKGYEEKAVRAIFNGANALAYDAAETRTDWSFALRPQTGPVRVDLPGPLDIRLTRMWLALAALSGSRLTIPGAVHNDAAFELMKAFNQVGATFSWDKSSLSHDGASSLDFNRKPIFVGQNSLNFYLLALAAAREPCSCKFTGSGVLKFMSMKPLSDIAPDLGARLVPLLPGGSGLPLRLEASGEVAGSIHLPGETPLELGLALAVAAPFSSGTPEEIHIAWSPAWRHAQGMERAASMLESHLGVRRTDTGLSISANRAALPESPDLPLDPFLSAYLLGLPAFAGGVVRLQGRFPDWLPEGRAALSLLGQAGLSIEFSDQVVTSTLTEDRLSPTELDCSGQADLFPLGVALLVSCPQGTALRTPEAEQRDAAEELLQTLGYESRPNDGTLALGREHTGRGQEVSIYGHTPFWILALALIALRRPHIVLKNPGDLTDLWPQFWSIYKGLPAPQIGQKQANETKGADNVSKRRRRIVE